MGYLERSEEKDRAQEILGEFTASCNVSDYKQHFLDISSKSTFNILPLSGDKKGANLFNYCFY